MATAYFPGQTVRLTGRFYNASDVLTDPTTVTLKVRNPAGTTTTYTYALAEVTKSSTGVFYKDLAVADADASEGVWSGKWIGTGAVAATDEFTFTIRKSAF